MNDQLEISERLHQVTRDLVVPAEVAALARVGGDRRLRRRRLFLVAGTVAVVGAVIPAAIALAQIAGRSESTPASHGNGDLYAAPPTISTCGAVGGRTAAPPSAYSNLLMLPKQLPVNYAFVNHRGAGSGNGCPPPHVALTMTAGPSSNPTRGVVVEGPDAPSTVQDGHGDDSSYSGTILHPAVDGVTGTTYYFSPNAPATTFWTDRSGGQWRTQSRGLTARQLVRMLGALHVDSRTGSAYLPHAERSGWSVQPAAPARQGRELGIFYALWHSGGDRIAMTIQHGPNRITQLAALARHPVRTTVHGRPAVVYFNGHIIWWQQSKDVTVKLTDYHASGMAIVQIARGVATISSQDPRLHRP
jgi:hypothetical protein